MSIEDRNLKPGTVLTARYKKRDHRCDVVKGSEAGKVRYRLKDGREFGSPSAAGSAVMDGQACNGWRFWSVEGTEPARKATTTPKAVKKAAPKAKGGRPAKRGTKAATRGKSSKNGARPAAGTIGCGECKETFPDAAKASEHMATAHAPAR